MGKRESESKREEDLRNRICSGGFSVGVELHGASGYHATKHAKKRRRSEGEKLSTPPTLSLQPTMVTKRVPGQTRTKSKKKRGTR